MSVPFVDLTAQYKELQSEIDAAIAEVISKNAFIHGEYAATFERSFAAYIGKQHCIGCANGTDAIEIALLALGIAAGDEVLVPANSFFATAEAVSNVGAVPIFVDCTPDTYTIDITKVPLAITDKTKAIIAVHLYGLAADMDPLVETAKKYGLYLIEDTAQAHGGLYKGKKLGGFGILSTFSFYPGKNLGAFGDAGAIITDDPALALECRRLINHGGTLKYEHMRIGRNSRLDGIQAVVLSAKLKRLDAWNDQRRYAAGQYQKKLAGTGITLPVEPEYAHHVYHLYVVRTTSRSTLQHTLQEKGIQTGIHYPCALPFLDPYKHRNKDASAFPNASLCAGQILSLPMFPHITEEHIDEVCKVIR